MPAWEAVQKEESLGSVSRGRVVRRRDCAETNFCHTDTIAQTRGTRGVALPPRLLLDVGAMIVPSKGDSSATG